MPLTIVMMRWPRVESLHCRAFGFDHESCIVILIIIYDDVGLKIKRKNDRSDYFNSLFVAHKSLWKTYAVHPNVHSSYYSYACRNVTLQIPIHAKPTFDLQIKQRSVNGTARYNSIYSRTPNAEHFYQRTKTVSNNWAGISAYKSLTAVWYNFLCIYA